MNPIWQRLQEQANNMQQQKIADLLKEPKRVEQYSFAVGDIYLDYSKNFIDQNVMASLLALADSVELTHAIKRLIAGEKVNITEDRPALHTALRRDLNKPLLVNQQDVMQNIGAQFDKMATIVDKLHAKRWLGATGKPITDVVNIGIGGSDLGPLMAVEALKHYQQSAVKMHFASNIDPVVISDLLKELNSETTLFIISSKSFSTPETLTNAQVAKNWLIAALGQSIENHLLAVTASPEKAQGFGVHSDNILTFEPWVGGRYSIWSTIGLPLAISIGMTHFKDFLKGASAMDEHFANAELAQNMPVILALLGIWYINFWQASTLAVLPYINTLQYLPDYLQQLDMESNGKQVTIHNQQTPYTTGPIVWGQVGTNGQHAFYQLLHQGTHFIPVDFIVAANSNSSLTEQHQQLIANCFAQAQALMQGRDDTKFAHEHMPGNKPSNILLLKKMTPFVLGQLLALYEHKVYVQGIIWQINSFDQPGVELGKKLADRLYQSIKNHQFDEQIDVSTQALIEKCREMSQ
ncbi:glucose-6-phosphate isomerase [Candidatus Berkiella aquae]|nr:glucose-6-phosphate isomerase [Candidatus Berkiella aquae]